MQTTAIKYNIVTDEGDPSSVTAFLGGVPLVATKDHPRFQQIVDYLSNGGEDEEEVKGLFDLTVGITNTVNSMKFQRLSDRVSAKDGTIFIDGDPVASILADTIVRFMCSETDFMPLVLFMEKIEQNPNPHSKEHLFRWLENKSFALAPDGDIIAYKGLDAHRKSITAGEAMVNGVVIKGNIPNEVGTIIEMPRSKVTFDPRNGCSTGLHVGNWSYAYGFARGKLIRVKVNPRDVVSVPTDSSDQKMRVCRYRVLDVVTKEDRSILYDPRALNRTVKVRQEEQDRRAAAEQAAAEAAKEAEQADKASKSRPKRRAPIKAADGKKVPAKQAAKAKAAEKKAEAAAAKKAVEEPMTYPKFYEDFTKAMFLTLPATETRWLCKEWEISPIPSKKDDQIAALLKEAKARKKTW